MQTEAIGVGNGFRYRTVWWKVDLGRVYSIYNINIQFKNYDGYGLCFYTICLHVIILHDIKLIVTPVRNQVFTGVFFSKSHKTVTIVKDNTVQSIVIFKCLPVLTRISKTISKKLIMFL